jgi:hypothetical protein
VLPRDQCAHRTRPATRLARIRARKAVTPVGSSRLSRDAQLSLPCVLPSGRDAPLPLETTGSPRRSRIGGCRLLRLCTNRRQPAQRSTRYSGRDAVRNREVNRGTFGLPDGLNAHSTGARLFTRIRNEKWSRAYLLGQACAGPNPLRHLCSVDALRRCNQPISSADSLSRCLQLICAAD